MARKGLSTRTVRMADKLTLCPSSEYSNMLREKEKRNQGGEGHSLHLEMFWEA